MSCCSLQVIGLCALLNLFSSLSSAAQGDALARYPPETLRKEATTVVLPMYPRSMLSLNKGGTCCCERYCRARRTCSICPRS
jgi:hypothetical protein